MIAGGVQAGIRHGHRTIAMTTQTEARPLFAATLTPHRSLSRAGLRYVVAGTAVAASIPGVIFFSLGAWPIVGFLGLDILAVWWALSASLRDGKRMEKVTLWPDELERASPAAARRAGSLQSVLRQARDRPRLQRTHHRAPPPYPRQRHRDRRLPQPGRQGQLSQSLRHRPQGPATATSLDRPRPSTGSG